MLKVMIVDDEIIVRVGIQSCIRWEEYGCEVIAACQSGREAMDFFGQDVPDIVFTDIMMPEVDGIQVVKYIRDYYPKTKVVVLSCLNEIDYVKKAIRYGAEDYILKLSFTPQTLSELLIKLREDIERECLMSGDETVYTDIKSFHRDEIFKKLFQMDMTADEQGELLDRLGIRYNPFESYDVICLLIDHYKSVYGRRESEAYVMKHSLLNVTREYMGGLGKSDIFFHKDYELVIILCHSSKDETGGEKIKDCFKLLNEALKVHLNLTVSGGVAAVDNRLALAKGYQRAADLAALRFFTGSGYLHMQEAAHEAGCSTRACFINRRSLQRKLQEAIFKREEETAWNLLREWFEKMRQYQTSTSIEPIKRSIIETWIFISGYSLPEEAEFEEADDRGIVNGIWEAETLEELEGIMREAVLSILLCLNTSKNTNSEIRELLSYLEVHISDNISLEEAAGRCALGRSQFCILFKKATGETFVNYFNKKKMKKAISYLSSENILVQEAALRVGMSDISYFNKLFKKYYGVCPSEVKKIGK